MCWRRGLRAEPEWSALPPDLEGGIREVLQGCFKKDPQERWRDIGDVALQIDRSVEKNGGRLEEPVSGAQSSRSKHSILRTATLASCVSLLLAGVITWVVWPRTQGVAPARLEVSLPPDIRPTDIALSPDGSRVAFAANGRVYTRAFGEWQVRPIPGTQGGTGVFSLRMANGSLFLPPINLRRSRSTRQRRDSIGKHYGRLAGDMGARRSNFLRHRRPKRSISSFCRWRHAGIGGQTQTYNDIDYPEVLPEENGSFSVRNETRLYRLCSKSWRSRL